MLYMYVSCATSSVVEIIRYLMTRVVRDLTTGDEMGFLLVLKSKTCLSSERKATTGVAGMSAPAIIGHVEPFRVGTDDWEQYEERMAQFLSVNEIEGNRKVAVFLTMVGPQAYALLSNLLAPDKPATKTYAELVETLTKHLKLKSIVIAERFKFHRRTQGETESVSEFMAALRQLADKCDFRDYLEEALRDRLVCGLRSQSIQKKLLAESELTLQKAYETAHGMEAAALQAGELQATSRVTSGEVQLVRKPRKSRNQSAKTASSACHRCGKPGHTQDRCYYKRQWCRGCGKYGHIQKMCTAQRVDQVDEDGFSQGSGRDSDDGIAPLLNIQVVKPNPYKAGIQLNLHVGGKPLTMELDTGASVSLISKKTWKNTLKSPPLSPSEIKLKTYSEEALKVLGQCMVEVRHGEQTCQAPLIVVAGKGPSLFGRNWLEKIRFKWGAIQRITSTPLDELLHGYAEVFSSDLGTMQGVEAHLEVQEGATPRFHRPRSVPYALQGAVEQDLERLE